MKKQSEKHGIPALMNVFLPGLGQIVKGEVGKGVLIMIGWVVSFLLCFILSGLILLPILYIWSIYDAYNN